MRASLSKLFLENETKPEENAITKDKTPPTLLLVDDEEEIIHTMKRVFLMENYNILTALSAEEGLKILEETPAQVIISDHRMPGMSGAEFLGIVKEKYPNTIRVMLTGYADISSVMGAINTGAVYKFITKPWNDEDLRVTISLALEQYELVRENRELKKQAKKRAQEIKKLARYVELNRSKLLNLLQQNGMLAPDKMEKVKKAYEKTRKPYPAIIGEMGYLSFSQISSLLKSKMGIETVAPKEYETPRALGDLFPEEFCRRNHLMPLKMLQSHKLLLAMADPTDYNMVEDIRFATGMEIVPTLAPSRELGEAQEKFFGKQGLVSAEEDAAQFLQFSEYDPYESIEIVLEEEETHSVEDIIRDSATPPAVRLVNLILWEALKAKASDIHIEKRVKYSLARFRVNGLMEDRIQIPEQMHQPVVSRIKIMSEMDIAERRKPQDGRVTVRAQDKVIDVRISTLPTISGEKVVMRILDRNSPLMDLSDLGADKEDIERLTALIHKPQGMILSTGPTGSGKTTSLYALLHAHSNPSVNYVTIEDPVEYFLEYAGQVLVKGKIGLDFATILRAILRQDPNVILLGEIRDYETAEVAFHAALTGHLVFSTLHTSSAVATVSRLLDLGVKPYIITSGIEGISAQRLVRRLCLHCAEETEPDPKILQYLGNPVIERSLAGKGCSACNNTGYDGRIGLFEILVLTQEMKKLISGSFLENELKRLARATGMQTLLDNGINKVNKGVTSLDEVFRVLGSQQVVKLSCPVCNQTVQEWMRCCPACGNNISNICPSCGAMTDEAWNYCPKCEQKLPSHKNGQTLFLED